MQASRDVGRRYQPVGGEKGGDGRDLERNVSTCLLGCIGPLGLKIEELSLWFPERRTIS